MSGSDKPKSLRENVGAHRQSLAVAQRAHASFASGFMGLAFFMTTLVPLGSLRAQDATSDILIRGRVVDAVTREPLVNAFVVHEPTSTGEVTDSLGRFELQLPLGRQIVLMIGRFGYQDMRFELPDSGIARPLVLPLEPDPVMLEGLDVAVDQLAALEGRIESRRRRYLGSARSLVGDEVRGSGTAYDLVRRTASRAFSCSNDGLELCSRDRRGRERQIRICINEQRAWGGILMLQSLSSEEVYILEIFGFRVTQVRLYTRSFMLQNMKRDIGFQPIEWGC